MPVGRVFPHPSMGPNQPLIQWAPRLSPDGKAAGGVTLTTHPPSSAAAKEREERNLYSPFEPTWTVLW